MHAALPSLDAEYKAITNMRSYLEENGVKTYHRYNPLLIFHRVFGKAHCVEFNKQKFVVIEKDFKKKFHDQFNETWREHNVSFVDQMLSTIRKNRESRIHNIKMMYEEPEPYVPQGVFSEEPSQLDENFKEEEAVFYKQMPKQDSSKQEKSEIRDVPSKESTENREQLVESGFGKGGFQDIGNSISHEIDRTATSHDMSHSSLDEIKKTVQNLDRDLESISKELLSLINTLSEDDIQKLREDKGFRASLDTMFMRYSQSILNGMKKESKRFYEQSAKKLIQEGSLENSFDFKKLLIKDTDSLLLIRNKFFFEARDLLEILECIDKKMTDFEGMLTKSQLYLIDLIVTDMKQFIRDLAQ
jgi:hypothetical protein